MLAALGAVGRRAWLPRVASASAAAAFVATTACEPSTDSKVPARFRSAVLSLRPGSAFGQKVSAVDQSAMAAARLVVFGEIHGAAPCVEMQRRTAETMLAEGEGRLHIVLEQCNFECAPCAPRKRTPSCGATAWLRDCPPWPRAGTHSPRHRYLATADSRGY